VDDFLIKYKSLDDLHHLFSTLRLLYEISTDLTDTEIKYTGITIRRDPHNQFITLSMPNYVNKALIRFQASDYSGANSPMIYVPPTYGAAGSNQAPLTDDSDLITDPHIIKRIQEITGSFLYYARAVDPTMLTAVNKIASAQARPTMQLLQQIDRLLNYAKRFPNAQLVLKPSQMHLICHSDASYLSETNSRSRIGGILYVGDSTDSTITNGSILHISTIIPVTVASAAEAEYAALFYVAQEAESLRNTLADLGYPQTRPTPIICDNQCAVNLSNNKVKPRKSKAMDMRFHWVKDRVRQRHFEIIWRPGSENLADFFTKAHPVHHFLASRSTYVTDAISPSSHNHHHSARRHHNRSLTSPTTTTAVCSPSGPKLSAARLKGCIDIPHISHKPATYPQAKWQHANYKIPELPAAHNGFTNGSARNLDKSAHILN
jgi:hypothetical protein